MVVDGGMVTLDVLEKAGPDVSCQVADPGIILSRANLTFRRNGQIVRARNSMLPVLSSKVRLMNNSSIGSQLGSLVLSCHDLHGSKPTSIQISFC